MKKDLSNKWIIIYSFIIYLLNYLIIKKENDLCSKWIINNSFIIWIVFIKQRNAMWMGIKKKWNGGLCRSKASSQLACI